MNRTKLIKCQPMNKGVLELEDLYILYVNSIKSSVDKFRVMHI